MTSGTDPSRVFADHQARLVSVLDRQEPFETLGALISSLHYRPDDVPLSETAIALDANVFLRISTHAKIADISDYLNEKHAAPLILPGQVIQEFWNNQLQAVDSIASSLKKGIDRVRVDISRIDTAFGDYSQRFESLTDQFSNEFGYAYDGATIRKTQSFLELIQRKARVPYAPRLAFCEIAAHRKKTKTPPGFRDDGDGDFYVWIDMLFGLLQELESGRTFSKVALVSHDRKLDWMRDGAAHPILISEVRALTGAPFEIWSIEQLARAVNKAMSLDQS